MNNKKKCFVIMPFSTTKSCTKEEWTGIFKGIIQPAVEESGFGYECERSVAERENIIKGILDALNQANVVIADLTDNNPNVFYELGVRHTLKNRTILIAQGEEYIPFDLKSYPTTFYSKSLTNIEEFRNDIKKKLEDIEKNPERLDNPVADFLNDKNITLLSAEKSTNLKKLSALVSELSENLSNVDIAVKHLSQIQKRRGKSREEKKWALNERFCNPCLELLLTTQYMLLPPDLLRFANIINLNIRIINKNLDLMQEFGKKVEKDTLEFLPNLRNQLKKLIKDLSKVQIDYENDNYIEPEGPTVILADPQHRKFLDITK